MSFVRPNANCCSLPSVLFSRLQRQGFVGLCLLSLFTTAGLNLSLSSVFAQGFDENKSDPAEIHIYQGDPIYLPIGETPPPAQEVDSRIVKEKYKGSDQIRFERRVIGFSDNSFTSDGPYKEFYHDGELFCEGAYKQGNPSGKWSLYYPSGEVAKTISYVDGHPNGEVKIYDEAGKLTSERLYKSGKREGSWTSYDVETGEPLFEQNYVNGKANGEWKIWFSNGQLRQTQTFKAGKREGVVTEWAMTGEKRAEAAFLAGKRHGKSSQWHPSGKIIEQVYENGKMISSKTTKSKGK